MDKIYLNANENPNTPKLPRNFLKSIETFNFNRYPDANYFELKKILSKNRDYSTNQMIITNGSDELIQIIIMALTQEKDMVVSLEPTFSEYRKISNYLGREYIGISPHKDLTLNKKALLNYIDLNQPKLIFLCTPNNPTGELLEEAYINQVINKSNGYVVIDEAYMEFANESKEINFIDHPNVVVMRTLSKAYGLAALRIGYGLGSFGIIEKLNKCRMPFNVSGISAYIACKFLKSIDLDFVKNQTLQEKERLMSKLDDLKISYLESTANFILFKVDNANFLYNKLKEMSIEIRQFKKPLLKEYLRFSVGTQEENDLLIKAIKEVYNV